MSVKHLEIAGEVSPATVPVSFKVLPVFNGSRSLLEEVDTDLLVLTQLNHMKLGPGPQKFDDILAGVIKSKLKEAHLSGHRGDNLLFETGNEKIRNVLVVGIGSVGEFGRPTMCGLFELILQKADEIGAKSVSLPIFPGRLTDCSLKGTTAVLRCRVAEHYARTGPSSLTELQILCAPQASRHITAGLKIQEPLCRLCRDPRIA